jgi:hypothetical protein
MQNVMDTIRRPEATSVEGYSVTMRDRTTERVDGADAFCHEKVMTTFYRTANLRRTVDCWSTPVASFRTDEILMIRRLDA